MLPDTLLDIHEELSKELHQYTSGVFKNTYEEHIILEVQTILNQIDSLRSKLGTPPPAARPWEYSEE